MNLKAPYWMIFFVVTLSLTLAPLVAFAESRVGNGGVGLYRNGKLVVLDLVESGVDDRPYLSDVIQPDLIYLERVSRSQLGEMLRGESLVRKLTEIRRVNPFFADAIMVGIERYSWRKVRPELTPTNDVVSPIIINKKDFVQLAVRVGQSIWLNSEAWDALDDVNQAALVIHEMIYSALKPELRDGGTLSQSSLKAREITGYLFTESLQREARAGLDRFALHDFSGSRLTDDRSMEIEALPRIRFSFVTEEEKSIEHQAVFEIWFDDRAEKNSILSKVCHTYRNTRFSRGTQHLRLVGEFVFERVSSRFQTFSSPSGEQVWLKTPLRDSNQENRSVRAPHRSLRLSTDDHLTCEEWIHRSYAQLSEEFSGFGRSDEFEYWQNLVLVFRHFNEGAKDYLHLSFPFKVLGYQHQGAKFRIGDVTNVPVAPFLRRLYQCYVPENGSYFESLDPQCEGARQEGSLGYIAKTGGALAPLALFRCRHLTLKRKRMITTDLPECRENGYGFESILGYVHPAYGSPL